jgi:hypothetical protein
MSTDAEGLVAKVVELEHHWILLSAVDARMRSEELDQIDGPFERQPLLLHTRLLDVALPVRRVMLLAVSRPAWLAEAVSLPLLLPPPGEVLGPLQLTAPIAFRKSVLRSQSEQMFA